LIHQPWAIWLSYAISASHGSSAVTTDTGIRLFAWLMIHHQLSWLAGPPREHDQCVNPNKIVEAIAGRLTTK